MRNIYIILFAFLSVQAFAQDYPLTGHFQNLNEKEIYYTGVNTLIRPATGCENHIYDSLIFETTEMSDVSWLKRKLFHEHLLVQKDERFTLILDPIIDFRQNYDKNTGERGYLNTRGILINGNLDSKIYFNTSFYENQGVFPEHINDFYNTFGVIPGYGRVKAMDKGYDFGAAYGNISLKATENLNFSIGYDRLFIGDGYRSMILSDFAAPLMYFKASAKFKDFEYSSIFTKALNPNFNNILYLDDPGSVNSRYPSKHISYNILTYNLNSAWQFSLFDAFVIAEDTEVWKKALYTISPFFRELYLDKGNHETNNLLGLNITFQQPKIGIFYSQLVLDRVFQSRNIESAFQLGYKQFDFLNISNLYFQLEYNYADAYMYWNVNSELHYGHYNQALAHPMGNKFNEVLIVSAYSLKEFEIVVKSSYINSWSTFGNFLDVCSPIYYLLVLAESKTMNTDIQLIYNVNKANRLQAFIGFTHRYNVDTNSQSYFYQFGVRTAIRSNYYDF